MFEILDRGGLGRIGFWTREGREVRTPAVLFAATADRPAPTFAEFLLTEERRDDPRPQLVLGGSFFGGPRGSGDLPLAPGIPWSVRDLEVPVEAVSGDFAVLTSESQISAVSGVEVVFLANGPEFLRHPRDFASLVALVRQELGPAKLLGVTGLACPSNLAVLAYAGIDLADSSRVLLDAARGLYHTADGVVPLEEADRASCACASCAAGGALRDHNEAALHRELLVVRNHLAYGRLRELVEKRLANDPWNTAVLRHLDLRHFDLVEEYTPVAGGELRAYSHESLSRPEIVRFRRRVRTRYAKPSSARVLVLLPCSARKPYSLSRSHRKFRDAILACGNPAAVHEVIVTSPLGLIPRELERFHPARAYDIPVTGDWNRDEAAMVSEDLRAFLVANPYDAVLVHLGAETPIVREAVPDALVTSDGRPTADEALNALVRALREVVANLGKVPGSRRFAEDMANLARFQFGDAGVALVERATYRGRFPDVRVFRGDVQVASHTGRGLLSLTLDGGRILSQADAYCVEIEDFHPKGNLFAVGVKGASPEIRVGDDVVVRHAGHVRAVGTARMNAREMTDARRGEAVHVRHVLSQAA